MIGLLSEVAFTCAQRLVQQIVGRERRELEFIADFQLPIVDLIRAAASTPPLCCGHV